MFSTHKPKYVLKYWKKLFDLVGDDIGGVKLRMAEALVVWRMASNGGLRAVEAEDLRGRLGDG